MKKIFVSVPMKGRTDEAIAKSITVMQNIAKAYFQDEEIEFIDNFVSCNIEDPKKRSLTCLGDAIKKMADADTLIIPNSIWESNGCWVERETAYRYGLRVIEVDFQFVCPDMYEAREKELNQCNGSANIRG